MEKYIAGIDLGGTTIKIGLLTIDGKLVESQEIPTRTENGGDQILQDIADAVFSMMNEDRLMLGAGLAVPGAVLFDTEVKPCVNLNGWGGADIATDLRQLIHMPVKVLNDANAAALGELWMGSGRGYSSLAFVTLGTGIGAGLIQNGKLINGAHGSAGEIGHLKLYGKAEADSEICGCGKKGCTEQFGSATGLVRLAKEQGFRKEDEYLSAKDVMDAALYGNDPAAKEAVHIFSEYIGLLLANLSAVFDPEAILIGGGVSKTGAPLLEMVTPVFQRYAFPSSEETEILLAALGSQAGMFGAAKYLIDSMPNGTY